MSQSPRSAPAIGVGGTAPNLALFAVMALIWGATWAAIKIGLEELPPIFLAAMRYALAALVLLIAVRGTMRAFTQALWKRVILSGLLVNAGTYGLLFWGMQTVPSGLSGLVNLSIIPVALFLLAVATDEERPSWRHAGALALGLFGLVALFWSRLGVEGPSQLPGLAAFVAGTLCYCFGTILSRPLVAELQPLQLAGAQALVGALGLAATSLLAEPITPRTFAALTEPAAVCSLVFLVLAGTVAAYTIYLRLLRDWGTVRAGLYAFVSPIIALILGAILFNETIGGIELLGGFLLLVAAGVALHGRSQHRVTIDARPDDGARRPEKLR